MSRSYGAKTQLLGKFESVYGTQPSGDYDRFPFISTNLDSEQGLIASDILGGGRDPAAPIRDVIKVGGNIVVPVDLRNIGKWLKAGFGAPTTTGGSAPYTHVFASGGNPASMTLEIGHLNTTQYFRHLGCVLDSMSFDFRRSGAASCTLDFIGQGSTRNGSSVDSTPVDATFSRFNQFQGSIKKDGVALTNITAATAVYKNNLSPVETIRSDGKIDGADPTIASFNGSITGRFADTTLLALAESGSSFELELAYTIDADNKLLLTAYEVYIPKTKIGIQGPGGVEVTFDFQAAKNVSAGNMLDVTLVNDVASYA